MVEALTSLPLAADNLVAKIWRLAPFVGPLEEVTTINAGHFDLLIFANGYAIASCGRVLEIGARNPFATSSANYYFGPQNYFRRRADGTFYDLHTGATCTIPQSAQIKFYARERLAGLLEFGHNLITPTPKIPEAPQFIGVPAGKFFPYRRMKTTKGYLCGSVASSVLFSYLQDAEQLTLPTILRQSHATDNSATLTAKLIATLQPLDFPTLSVQLALGWQRFFHHYRIKVTIAEQSFGARAHFIQLCQKNQPAVIGVLRFLGSSYGNHWVTAYAYAEDSGQTFYQLHDNWGDYRKIIASSWGNALISVSRRATV